MGGEVNLINLQEAIDKNIQTVQPCAGKKLIVLFGSTRSGKSTTIAILRNQRILAREVKIETSFAKVKKKIFIVEGDDSSHERFVACTDTMRLFDDTGEYSIVDSTGLFDTNGVISEIAHKAAFDYIIQHAKSIIPIILINYSEFSGSGSYVKALLKIVSSIFNNDSNKLEKSLIICLTHIKISASREDIITSLLDMYQAQANPILEKAIIWLGEGNPRIQVIQNPCKYDGRCLWSMINSVEPLIAKEIEFNLEKNSKNIFANSMEEIKNEMISCVKNKTFDPIIKTITVLSSLNKYIPDLVGNHFNFVRDKITNLIIREHKDAEKTIETILERKQCGDKEIKKLTRFFELMECSKDFRNSDFVNSPELKAVDRFEKWLMKGIHNFVLILQDFDRNEKDHLQNIKWNKILSILNVLSNLSKLPCAKIQLIYDNECNDVTSFLLNITKSLRSEFNDIRFLLDVQNINRLSKVLTCLQKSCVIAEHMINFNQNYVIDEIKQKFLQLIQQSHNDLQQLLQNINVTDISMIGHCLSDIKVIFDVNKLISQRYELFESFTEEECKKNYENVKQLIEYAIEENLKTLKTYTDSINADVNPSSESIKNLKLYSQVCVELTKLSDNTKFTRLLTERMSLSKVYIRNISNKIKGFISFNKTNSISENIINAVNLLKKLRKLFLFDKMSSNDFAERKYEKCKKLICSKMEYLISSLETFWKIKAYNCFNETWIHIEALEDAAVFSKINYKDNDVYNIQKMIYIQKISASCEDLLNLFNDNPKDLNNKLALIDNYRKKLPNFNMQNVFNSTEDQIISKLQDLIQNKLNLIIQNRDITYHLLHDSSAEISKKNEKSGPKRKTINEDEEGESQMELSAQTKSMDILEALNFLHAFNNYPILQSKLQSGSKRDYYEEGKISIIDTMDEIKFQFDYHMNNHNYIRAKKFYDIFQKFCVLNLHFPDILDRCKELKLKLNTESNDSTKDIEIMLEKHHFRNVKKTFQNIIDNNNRRLAIFQIIDFLHDYFNKKLFVLCNDFVPVKADEIGNGYVEVSIGPTEKLENAMKQLSNFKNYLIVDDEIEKLIFKHEIILQNKLVEIFEKELKNCEDKYNSYFVSVCNCITDNILVIFKKLQIYLPFTQFDMATKVSCLQTKYEKKLFADLANALKNEKIREFAMIWEASNKIPKQQIGTTDRILEQVKIHIELYYDKKIADCNDSNSIQELRKLILPINTHGSKLPESILKTLTTKLNAKQNKLQKLLENEVNSLLNRNDFDTISYKINTSKGTEKTYIINAAQEYFDQLISIVNPQSLNSNDPFVKICICKEKLGNSLKNDKFESLIHQLNLNLNQ